MSRSRPTGTQQQDRPKETACLQSIWRQGASGSKRFEQSNDLLMSLMSRQRQWRSPGEVVRQGKLRAASQQELDHTQFVRSSRVAKRRGAELLIAYIEVGAVLDEDRRLFHIALLGKTMKRPDTQPARQI